MPIRGTIDLARAVLLTFLFLSYDFSCVHAEHNEFARIPGYIPMRGFCVWSVFVEFVDFVRLPHYFTEVPAGQDCRNPGEFDPVHCITHEDCAIACDSDPDCTSFEVVENLEYCSLWFNKCKNEVDDSFQPFSVLDEITYVKRPHYTGDFLEAHAFDDPHLALGDGGKADFRGENNTIYNLLSAKNVSLNSLFQFSDFVLPGPRHKLVHGSFMREAYIQIRSGSTGRLLQFEFNSSHQDSANLYFPDGLSESIVLGPLQKFEFEDVVAEMGSSSLCVSNRLWRLCAVSEPYPGLEGSSCSNGKCVLQVSLSPLSDLNAEAVAPHGIIGQSWDGDGTAINGAEDDYSADEVTTQAQAEGAIEGNGTEYKMTSKFSTEYKYSRFSAVAAAPRNVALLKAQQRSSVPATRVYSASLRDAASADRLRSRSFLSPADMRSEFIEKFVARSSSDPTVLRSELMMRLNHSYAAALFQAAAGESPVAHAASAM